MPIITKITTQQKNKERYNIFMDHGEGEKFAFSVEEEVLIRFHLKKGLELDDFSIMEIHYEDDIRKAYNMAIGYLARRIRSEKEMNDYLIKKEIEEPVIQEVLHRLLQQKYIDDQEFAFAYVRTQVNTTDKGPELIQKELKEKGIQKDMIETALDEYTFDQQVEKALILCEKFVQKNSKDSNRVLKQKLENLLVRKGHKYDVISHTVNESTKEQLADDELTAIRFQGEKAHQKLRGYSGFEYEQKMKQALYRKGFSIEVIEQFLSERRK